MVKSSGGLHVSGKRTWLHKMRARIGSVRVYGRTPRTSLVKRATGTVAGVALSAGEERVVERSGGELCGECGG